MPTNFINVIIPYLIKQYDKYIRCCRPNKECVTELNLCYEVCDCKNCAEYSVLREIKSCTRNQNLGRLK